MSETSTPNTPLEDVLAVLLDSDQRFAPRYLYRLSDLEGDELAQLEKTWSDIPTWRRLALLEDMEQLYEVNYLLSFESVCRLALADSNPQIRFVALRSLLEYEVDDLIPMFIDILEKDEDEELRALAATSLGKYVFLGEIEELSQKTLTEIENCLLRAAQEEETTLVRRRAVESLGYSSRDEVPALIESAFLAKDTDWLVSALFAMGRSYDKRWHSKVLGMLDHLQPDVRYEAARAAGELEIADAKPRLLELLDDDDHDVHMATVWSLSQIGGEGLQEIFSTLLDETEDEEDAEFIKSALDNLIFNQSMGLHGMMDFPEDDFDFVESDENKETEI